MLTLLKNMRILIIGSGAREHAIARALKKSPQNVNIFCFGTSNNPGIQELSTNYMVGNITDSKLILNFAKQNNVDLAVIGPEAPLAAGVVDVLIEHGIYCIGPKQKLAQIETSKGFTRDLMMEFDIPGCPKYKKFNSMSGVEDFLNELKELYVIKYDGLMGGKGVKVAGDHLHSHEEALQYCQELIDKAGSFVIEEKLIGQEFSLMSFCDGQHMSHMPAVQDHKRAFVNDEGPNTGGMGSYSDTNHSLPFLTNEDIKQAHEINQKTAQALRQKFGEGYKGILYGGFMATRDGVKLIEYNARFGDPEAENVLAILETDFVMICNAIVNGTLNDITPKFFHKATVCKFAVPIGYPDNPLKNERIDVTEVKNQDALYFMSVDMRPDGLYLLGSRAVAVIGIGDSIEEAEKRAEKEINLIQGPLFHREDIGTKELIQKRISMMKDITIEHNDNQDTLKLAILGSTRGTDMDAVASAIKNGQLNASIEIVISDKPDAYILERAKNHGLNILYVPKEPNESREEYDDKLIRQLSSNKIDLILLIGYMRILSDTFVQKYQNKIINVHPSLLPAFAGGMDLNVHKAVLQAGVKITGCTVHFVDETVDGGKILVQKACSIKKEDTEETLKNKVQKLEGEALVEAIKIFEEEYNVQIAPIKRALISVSNKDGIVDFARELYRSGVEIISTGGTAKILREANVPVIEISDFTGFPEMMDGRVKTLHPLVHAGILGRRDEHSAEARQQNIRWIDLVICNLYPFLQTIQKPDVTETQAIENIDIGGPAMIRSAAKNVDWVGVVVDPRDYSPLLEEIKQNKGLTEKTRKKLSAKAFAHTAQYDAVIAAYFKKEQLPETLTLTYDKAYDLRYGENPHQKAAVYAAPYNHASSLLNAKIHQGKKLSYNNLNDADGALATLKEFTEPACVVVKHANPCGVAVHEDITEAFKKAYNADSLSAFGGIIAINRPCNTTIAEEIARVFAEIVIAPSYEPYALQILAKKKNMRVLELNSLNTSPSPFASDSRSTYTEFKSMDGGLLIQDVDTKTITRDDLQFVTEKKPTEQELKDMLFGWKVLKHVKSNAILTAKNNTTLGIGPGQVSRVDSVDIAIKKSGTNIYGAILASDAFFPFRDSIDKIAQTGIKAIIQPGGSIKDEEVIAACNEYGIAMVFTGVRCFKH